MNSNSYLVEVTHPALDSLCGHFQIQVTSNTDGSRYASSPIFGCSKDYDVSEDETAIRRLVAEHGASVLGIAKRDWWEQNDNRN